MRRQVWNLKRDASEKPIVEALRSVGADVWRLTGTGCPDLLVRFQGRWMPFEVKTGKGTKTEAQRDIPWPIVRTAEEVLTWIGVKA